MAQNDQGQGQVKNPETDRRLKEHGGGQNPSQHASDDGRGQVQHPDERRPRLKEHGGGQNPSQHASDDGRGQVKDPGSDGRLKQNR